MYFMWDVGDPIFRNKRVVRDEDGNKIMTKPTHKKKTVYDRVKTMKDKLLEYDISEEGRDYEDILRTTGL